MANSTRQVNEAATVARNDAREQRFPAEPQAPVLPRPRMPLAQRAKIFIPFDPLKGYQDALRAKEREAEAAHDERISFPDAP